MSIGRSKIIVRISHLSWYIQLKFEKERVKLPHPKQISKTRYNISVVDWVIVIIEWNEIGNFYMLSDTKNLLTSRIPYHTQTRFHILLYLQTHINLEWAECQICVKGENSVPDAQICKMDYISFIHLVVDVRDSCANNQEGYVNRQFQSDVIITPQVNQRLRLSLETIWKRNVEKQCLLVSKKAESHSARKILAPREPK